MKFILASLTACWLAMNSMALTPAASIYQQDFETVGFPGPEWYEWIFYEFHPDTWNSDGTPLAGTNSVQFANGDPLLSMGAFCELPFPCEDIKIDFLYKVTAYPPSFIIEIMDMYDFEGDEVADIYINPAGNMLLTIGGTTGTATTQIPLNTTIHIWFHYINNYAGFPTSTAAWSTDNVEPTSGGQFVSRADGTFHSPITRYLIGPVSQAGVTFYYDNFNVATVIEPPKNLTVTGDVRVAGSLVFK